MNIFNLPDLGEGLPHAEINTWYVKEGDTVAVDQPLVSVETDKALVDVPSPQDGVIARCFGNPGDMIKTGEPLVGFVASDNAKADKGTVVGHLEESTHISDDHFIVGANPSSVRVKATPSVRLMARKLKVSLDTLKGTGDNGFITLQDVEAAAKTQTALPEGFEPLKGVRKAMCFSMSASHQEVVPVSIFDVANIHAWQAGEDITVRLIKAISEAITIEPALNAWFNTAHMARRCFNTLHLGLAMDNEEGLFVPVIHDANTLSHEALRDKINALKQTVKARTISGDDLKGATLTLSNFGKFAGQFASPIIVPPQVAILAVGRLYVSPVAIDDKTIAPQRLLPLSLSFDHRAVTGGEATRFLGAVITALKRAE